jgi:hypothetical protein
VTSMMRPSCCWTYAPIRLLPDVVELPLTVVCCPASVRLPWRCCTCLSAGADPDLSWDSCWHPSRSSATHPYHSCCRAPVIEGAEVKRSGVCVVDRGEPKASCSEWHGDGTAGENDLGSAWW